MTITKTEPNGQQVVTDITHLNNIQGEPQNRYIAPFTTVKEDSKPNKKSVV